ncbi:hypothetical protein JCM10908_005610 [Rhodotorula pacifica]|uniref:uncharacterized protein n=1 Tax=Rhodotorula pacifica TaxID=1495444 RepID=UPI0031790190
MLVGSNTHYAHAPRGGAEPTPRLEEQGPLRSSASFTSALAPRTSVSLPSFSTCLLPTSSSAPRSPLEHAREGDMARTLVATRSNKATTAAFVALLGAVRLASATSIQSPALYQCTPAAFQYECTSPPCTVVARPANDPTQMIANLGTVNDASGTLSWPVSIQAGSQVTVYITDNSGVIGNGAPTTVAAGTSTSCASEGSSTSSHSEGAHSSASSASSSASSAASSRTSSASSAASSTSSNISSTVSGASSSASKASESASSEAASASASASASAPPSSGAAHIATKVGAVLGAAALAAFTLV